MDGSLCQETESFHVGPSWTFQLSLRSRLPDGQAVTSHRQIGEEERIRTMKFHIGIIMIILGLSMGIYRHGLQPRGWGSQLASASKAGKIGKMSLKSTLSVLSMVGAYGSFFIYRISFVSR